MSESHDGGAFDVLVIGFGAVGCIWSYILEQSGRCRVTAVARSAFQALDRDGVHLKSAKFGDHPNWKPHRIVGSAADAADRSYAFIICTFKCLPDIQPTASVIAPFIRELDDARPRTKTFPTIVLIQNGIGIEQPLAEALPSAHIISGVAWIGANLLLPGQDPTVTKPTVDHGALEKLVVGLYEGEGVVPPWSAQGGSPDAPVNSFYEGLLDEHGAPLEPSARARRQQLGKQQVELFAGLLRAGGGNVEVVENAKQQASRWQKNLWNSGWGSLSALGRSTTSACVAREVLPITLPIVRRVMIESLYVARALNYNEDLIPASSVDFAIDISIKACQAQTDDDEAVEEEGEPPRSRSGAALNTNFKPSILIDLENGRPMELEPILGAVLDRARLLNVETPRLDLAYTALKVQQEAAAHRYAALEANVAQAKHLHEWSMRKPSVAGAGATGREAWLREVRRRTELAGASAYDKVTGKPAGGPHV